MPRRHSAALALVLLLAGCSDATGPGSRVDVFFRVDAQSCSGTGTLNFFIDGALVGTETMPAGSTSKPYTTTRAQHVLGAREVASGQTWGPANVDLTPHSTYTQVLTC